MNYKASVYDGVDDFQIEQMCNALVIFHQNQSLKNSQQICTMKSKKDKQRMVYSHFVLILHIYVEDTGILVRLWQLL